MTATDKAAVPVGAVLASALMAAHYGGDSGEDVDRLIEELARRGYAVQPTAPDLRLDVEWLREAIYIVSVRHAWATNADTGDRTEEIAAEYARIARAYAATPPSPAPETLTEAAALSGYRPGMAFGTGGNELPPSPAPEGERTLDAAWADLRAVLPDEWIVILYDSGPPTTYNPGPESPFHGPRYLARADIGIRSGPPRISAQSDESPAAALDALRAALAATPAPEVEP